MLKYFFGFSLSFFMLCVGLAQTPAQQAVPTAQPNGAAQTGSEFTNTISPLIDDQVVLIVHMNLKEFDFDLILEKTILYLENGIKRNPQTQNIDARAMTMVRNRLAQEFNYMFRDFREIREKLINEAGINDIFLLVYRDMTSLTPIVMVTPQANKTAPQRRAFARIVRGAFPILFSEKGFMICSAPLQSTDRDKAELALKTKLKNLKGTSTAYLPKAFAQQAGSVVTIVGVIPPNAAEMANQIPEGNPEISQIANNFRELIKVLADKVKWVSVGVNLQNVSVNVIAQTPTAEDANAVLEAYKKTTDVAFEEILKRAPTTLAPERLATAQKNAQTLFAQFQPQVNAAQLQLLLDEPNKPEAFGVFILPVVMGFRNSQHLIWGNQCALNMKSLGAALLKYHEVKGHFPPVWTTDAEGKPLHSWRVLILPYLAEDGLYEDLYNAIKLDEPWDSAHNQQFHTKMPMLYRCPASRLANNMTTSYSLIVGENAFPQGPETLKLADVTDPHATTIMMVERSAPVVWMKPDDISEEIATKGVHVERGIGSNHMNGVLHVYFFDGTLRVIRGKPPEEIFKGLITINGGEDTPLP